ncbi:hydroxymethylbilane synthase [Desulforhopalus sp. IMCC35007]|uniref:hydroxymethylbilane synthase n=1 Tax=Desulforhopalus sp. IMCC35007 TaxID=2569543 RepID=UPI0010AE2A20|nr:hydroxymethylbilane synthase [Desulforhopalus sp. IMCC35007]TKB09905.1 hydroxymethylbilane synthase [Desulforhopalus sp. IMCC35007]
MITIGTRKSKLAMWQTETVAGFLNAAGIETQISSMETIGDKVLDRSIAKIGSKGVFTVELEEQLANGSTDIAVHSAKDMQSVLPEGFKLIAFTEREKANDVLVSGDKTVDITNTERPLIIGTSSVRRRAFLRNYYPHVKIVEMRGNLQTRIRKMEDGDCDALMLAYAGVKRMGYEDMVVHEFDVTEFTPPVGQGCIAIEAAVSLDPEKLQQVRRCLNNQKSECCLLAERAFLKTLEGGCSIPAFGHATLSADGSEITLTAGLASLDGATILRRSETDSTEHPEILGARVGEYILANNGREMLLEIRRMQAAD